MPTGKQTYLRLSTTELTAQFEDCIISFFKNTADIQLVKDNSPLSTPTAKRNITAVISFSGIERGFLAINCSETMARQLAISIMGDINNLQAPYLCTILEETSNILTASLLELVTDNMHCKISAPACIRNDSSLIKKLLADARGYTGSFFCGNEQVLLKLVIHPAECSSTCKIDAKSYTETAYQAHQLFSCPRFGKPCRKLQALTEPDSGIYCR